MIGDANIDAAWRGVWKRPPASFDAVSRELAGFQALGHSDTGSSAPEAIKRGESILDGYSGVLGTKRAIAKPRQAAAQKKRLYDSFILQGGKKAQLYDAATHDQELHTYSGVLSFNDRPPAQAINGPTKKAIKSSKDELSSYSSILDFNTPLPDFKSNRVVNLHKGILSFPGNTRDRARIRKREANHHVLQASAVAAVHDSHKNILNFPKDQDIAKTAPRKEAERKVTGRASPAVKGASENTARALTPGRNRDGRGGRAVVRQPASHTLQPELISRELSSYDDILEFPGQRQLSQLADPPSSSHELEGYDGILEFGGLARSARSGDKKKASKTGAAKAAAGAAGSAPSDVAGVTGKARGSKRGARTMLLDEELVRQTVADEKAVEQRAILIEPPDGAVSSPIAKKLASLYEEAKKLISEETEPTKKPSGSRRVAASPGAHGA